MPTKPTEDNLFRTGGGSPVAESMSLEQMTELFDSTPWSQDFAWREIEVFARHMIGRHLRSGEELFAEGEPGDYMAIVVEGRVSVWKESSDGERRELAMIGPGKTLGEMALVDGEPRSASAVASSSATLLLLTRDQFERLARDYPGLAFRLALKIASMLSQRLRRTSGVLVDYLGE